MSAGIISLLEYFMQHLGNKGKHHPDITWYKCQYMKFGPVLPYWYTNLKLSQRDPPQALGFHLKVGSRRLWPPCPGIWLWRSLWVNGFHGNHEFIASILGPNSHTLDFTLYFGTDKHEYERHIQYLVMLNYFLIKLWITLWISAEYQLEWFASSA